MTDAELDALQKRLDKPPFGTETSERLLFGAAFEAITYLRATLKSVLQREAEAYVRHDAKADALETQLAERDALGAVVTDAMVEAVFSALPGVKFGWLITRDEMRAALTAALAQMEGKE